MATDKPDPSIPSADYQANATSFAVLRTVMAGTEAMRAASETYLPKHPSEKQSSYDARKLQTVLHNRLEGAVRAAVGKPMSDPVNLAGDGYDPTYDVLIEDIDLLGNSLDVFARNLFEDAVVAGLAYILVDMPRSDPTFTLADEVARNIRPYFIHYRAEDVLSCTISVAQGRPMVIDARFIENTVRMVGFSEVTIRRVRHWRSDGWDLWEMATDDKGAEKDWGIIASGPNLLAEVACVPLFTGRRTRKTGFSVKPPFLDLAWKNVEHWQSSSDQRNILKYARFPILAGSGIKMPKKGKEAEEAEPITLGPDALLITEDPQGEWYYVEPTGAGIASGAADLERLDVEMDMLSMKPHLKGSGEVTAREVSTSEDRENSGIKNMALNLKDALERAFVFAERLRGAADVTRAPEVEVSTEYGDEIAEGDTSIDQLTKARVAGQITRETYWSELQRRGQLSRNFDPVAEANTLDAEGSGIPTTEEDPLAVDPAAKVEPVKVAAE